MVIPFVFSPQTPPSHPPAADHPPFSILRLGRVQKFLAKFLGLGAGGGTDGPDQLLQI
jgi:hypothetical protein